MKRYIVSPAVSAGVEAQQQSDWANFTKYASANEAAKQLPQSERNVVFMGDSITERWYGQHPDFFTENKYVNRGISGQVTAQMLARFRRDVLDLHPKVAVILCGTGDVLGNGGFITLENIFGNIVSMCELARANDIKVLLCCLLPVSKGGSPNAKIPQLNAMIKAYAEKNATPCVDYFSAMTDGSNGLPKTLSEDGVHPNLEGNKIMERLVQPAIEKTK